MTVFLSHGVIGKQYLEAAVGYGLAPDHNHDIMSQAGNEEGYMLREFFLGFIKLHILYHAAQEPVFGLELMRELGRHGYALSPGTLYPILHKLEREGYLRQAKKLVDGKVRKYYRATARGQRTLAAARPQIVELVSEVVEEAPARPGRRARR
jgi:PadR family transcriptional regulator